MEMIEACAHNTKGKHSFATFKWNPTGQKELGKPQRNLENDKNRWQKWVKSGTNLDCSPKIGLNAGILSVRMLHVELRVKRTLMWADPQTLKGVIM